MLLRDINTSFLVAVVLLAGSCAAARAGHTIASFSTIAGDFDVLLYDDQASGTVRNFMRYAESGRYDGTFIHRSTTYNPFDLQIIQGGSYLFSNEGPLAVPLDPPILLEAGLPNVRGTIAMARQTAPNTATAGWFFNVTDNPGLDPAPGKDGYAVFGRVLADGMEVVDLLASVPVYNVSGVFGIAFAELPALNPFWAKTNVLTVWTVSTQPFRVSSVARTGAGFQVDWSGPSAATPVNVERTTNLATGPWEVVSSNNTGGTFTDPEPPGSGAYYRVVLP